MQSEQWAADLLAELVARVGMPSPIVWEVRVNNSDAPALARRLAAEPVRIGQLMASPWGRSDQLGLVPLMLVRAGEGRLCPEPDTELALGDVLLVAGAAGTPRAWEATLHEDETLGYVLHGRAVGSTWWGRRLLGSRSG
jgi:hypothetical protein